MWLLKAGGCLIQFKYVSLRILGQLSSGCLIQVGCLIEVTTNTGLTVFNDKQCRSRSVGFSRFTHLMTNMADSDQLASEKSTDLDRNCLQRQGISGFNRTRVKQNKTDLCNT